MRSVDRARNVAIGVARWAGLAALLAGVGSCENEVDKTKNELIPNAGVSGADTGGGDSAVVADVEAGSCEECPVEDRWFRANLIRVDSIDNDAAHLAVSSLNGEWAGDISKGELTLFFHVVGRGEGTVDFEVVNGARSDVDNSVCIIAERTTPIATTQTECTVQSASLVDVFIYGGSPAHPKICVPSDTAAGKNAIYIEDVNFTATLDAGCDEMQAHVQGVIDVDVLEKTCSCLYLKDGELSDECGLPAEVPEGGKNCGGCGLDGEGGKKKLFSNLKASLAILAIGTPSTNGELGLCSTEAGGKGVCLEASLEMKAVDPPPVCP